MTVFASMSGSDPPLAATGDGHAVDPAVSDSGSGPTPPTVKRPRTKRAVATVPFPSPPGPAPGLGGVVSANARVPKRVAPPPPPWKDPNSSPGLDTQRRLLVDELKQGFPLSLDAKKCAVVLVCGDMRDETSDWLALVLAIDRLETDGVLFVKPLETVGEGGDREEAIKGNSRPGSKNAGAKRTPADTENSTQTTPTKLQIAAQYPIEILDAAAVMDLLHFEGVGVGSGSHGVGVTGTVRERSGGKKQTEKEGTEKDTPLPSALRLQVRPWAFPKS